MFRPEVLRPLRLTALLLFVATLAGGTEDPRRRELAANDPPKPATAPAAKVDPIRLKHAELRTALLAARPAPGITGSAVAVKLLADATPARVGLPAGVAFKMPATPDALAALKGVSDFLNVRHHGLPTGQKVEITLVGDAAAADLASSSFAAAVAVESMLTGWTPDPGLAVIGAVQNNGDLVPVNNPIPRLLAAMRGGAERVLLPEKMFKQVTDVLVSEGPVAFAKAQIFTISNFDDAAAIASASPEASIVRAIRRFAEVERMLVAGGPDADATLREPACKEALREVLTTAPSHMSARLLLGRTTGQYTTLSIEGSFTALEAMCTTMLKAARSRNPTDLSQLPNATVQAEAARLGSARTRLDAKAQPIADALLTYADVVRAWTERPPANASQQGERFRSLSAAAKQILSEMAKAKPAA